jgi:regulator of sirC expression with transglutaminase-like and TPR domain
MGPLGHSDDSLHSDAVDKDTSFHRRRSYIHPYFPCDIWRLIIPFLDGPSLVHLSLSCKDNFHIFLSNKYNLEVSTFLDDEDELAAYAWRFFCRQRWPSVQKLALVNTDNDHHRTFHCKRWWHDCYRRMHLQDKQVDHLLSIILSRNTLYDTPPIDLICQLFCSSIAVDELLDGLLLKCSLPTPTLPFITPSRVMAGLLLLEVNQVFAMQRLCRLWTDRMSSNSFHLVEQGALLIAQLCQSVSELIHGRSLYALEEKFQRVISQLTNQVKNKLKNTDTISMEHGLWIEEMKKLFSTTDPRQMNDREFDPFSGNTEKYYDWHNSLLDKVMEYRKGIPITLCIIYASIVHRAVGVDLHFIGLPGHFVLAIPSIQSNPSNMIFIDPFHGGISYTLSEVRDIVEMRYGVPWSEKFIHPLTPEKVWVRMIANIVNTSRDYSIPSQTVLLDVIKRRLDVTQFPPLNESDVDDIIHRFVLLSPLCSYESNDILALTQE